ncbi:MAG: hypothetical protein COU85_01455 [Candidatus Portnoybacteria bacterium CG10_big_fil_rev_8_21_14_0_10_44_7]|uniref:Dephospho-CoA kinase n=1 Tax=Candidatus Portnoybacteria bacterium CG10_big_fil_rev_8_21_14_0_10_44_7 TaxID=1974816 RepID=A0A2M8KIW2_9BACT|nr:MAG: hypothetical protein COU85_01455 [Candidatus Portnoybacteria bacterium CG10_big_fil_rev_8_21_14_0_10_44_7]
MLNKIILALVGKPAAGKGTVVDLLRQQLKGKKVLVIRFSDVLTQALTLFLDKPGRQDCQWLVSCLRERYGEDILARAAERKLKQAKFDVAILDGLRVGGEEAMLRRVGGQLIFVDTPAKTRWERIGQRQEKGDDTVSFTKFLEIDQALPEKQIAAIGSGADFKIDNAGDLASLKKQVEQISQKLNL